MKNLFCIFSVLCLCSGATFAQNSVKTHFIYPQLNKVMQYNQNGQLVGETTHKQKTIVFHYLNGAKSISHDFGNTWNDESKQQSFTTSYAFSKDQSINIPIGSEKIALSFYDENSSQSISLDIIERNGNSLLIPNSLPQGRYSLLIKDKLSVELVRIIIY